MGDSESSPLLFSAKTINAKPNLFLLFLAVALVLNIGGVLFSVNVLVKYDYTDFGQILYWYNVVGIAIFLFSVIVGPFTIGLTLIELSRLRAVGNAAASTLAVIMGLGCFAGVVPAWTSLIKPEATFYSANRDNDQVRQFLGGFITVIYPMVGVLCLVVAVKLARRGSFLQRSAPVQPSVPHQRASFMHNMSRVVTLLLVAGICWFFTTFLSGTWNYGVSYFGSQSPWSLSTAQWNFHTATSNLANGATPLPAVIFLKVYEDVCVWFSIVVGVALLGAVAVYRPAVRRVLHKRVFVMTGLPEFFFEFAQGFCLGELVVILAVLALFAFNFYYWTVKFTYIDTAIATMGDPYPLMQKWARIMGHMATLSMSLLILPAARNSVWEACFGIPFERFLKYHRVMGRICWMFTTIHMILFQAKWMKEGLLWNNVFNIRNLLITNYNANCAEADPNADPPVEPGPCAHLDNWTIPVVEAAWLVLTIILILAQVCRRWNYNLFYYTHYFSWFFLVASLLHAWTHWYYVATGFVLYFLDKLARTMRACEDAHVVALSHTAGITRLEVSAGSLRDGFLAGQYAFINIPAVSQFQWHPFSMSSSPYTVRTIRQKTQEAGLIEYSVSTATFHIRDMGPGTWTHQLALFAQSFETRCDQRDVDRHALLRTMTISVDGPYGRPAHYHDKQTLVMVAGGIGITPFHSIVADIYRQTFTRGTRLRNVHLVWVVRDPALLAMFAETWAEVIRRPVVGQIRTQLHLFCTGRTLEIGNWHREGGVADGRASPGYEDSGPLAQVANLAAVQTHTTLGRPDLSKVLEQAAAELSGPSDDAVALVCGPNVMIADVSRAANRFGMDFFYEVFHF